MLPPVFWVMKGLVSGLRDQGQVASSHGINVERYEGERWFHHRTDTSRLTLRDQDVSHMTDRGFCDIRNLS